MNSTIAIHYRLLQSIAPPTAGSPRQLVAVGSTADLELERELQAADTDKRVKSVSPVTAQNEVLHAHALSVPFDLPIRDYLIQLEQYGTSIWDRDLKAWIRVETGGAIYFAVDKPGDTGRLFLAVWTEGATPAQDLVAGATS